MLHNSNLLLSRWLLAVGRRKEAEIILASAEKENGRSKTEKENGRVETGGSLALEDKAKNLAKEDGRFEEAGQGENVLRGGDEAESAGNVFDLFKTPHLRKSTLIM